MNATEITVAAYRQMTRALRELAREPHSVSTVPKGFLADLDQIITETEYAISKGELPFADPVATGVSDVQALSRWLWNRGFGSSHMAAFDTTHRAVLMGSAGLTGTPEMWQSAARLVAKVEARIEREPGLANTIGKRHNIDEHEQWLPVAHEPTPAPAAAETETADPSDPFKNSKKAVANRLTKAKALARWLWDRDINGETLLSFTPKYQREIARAAGVLPPSSMETWDVALRLMKSMEARVTAEPDNPAIVRHHLDEHDGWVSDPHAEALAAA